MGVSDLRAAFNTVAEPRYSAQRATLRYVNRSDIQFQVLTFSGSDADGKPFSVNSDQLRPGTDVNLAAAAVAQALLDKTKDVAHENASDRSLSTSGADAPADVGQGAKR